MAGTEVDLIIQGEKRARARLQFAKGNLGTLQTQLDERQASLAVYGMYALNTSCYKLTSELRHSQRQKRVGYRRPLIGNGASCFF
jgi:hypothetical protein